jgi:hypothetical protein
VSLGHLRRRPLPPALAQELGALWAEILVAEYQRRREVATATVESGAGLNRREGDGVRPAPAPSVHPTELRPRNRSGKN